MKIIHAKKLVSRIISVPSAHCEAASATEERRDTKIMAHSASIVTNSVGAALQPLPQLACIVWRCVGRTECSLSLGLVGYELLSHGHANPAGGRKT